MVGAMLVGAWLLIHQQCCVSGDLDARMRSPFDSMTRRSPLEKNFMRFGRSWEPGNKLIRALRSTDNFIRFGKSDDHLRSVRAKENFIRFGRNDPDETEDIQTLDSDDEFQRFLRSKENFMRFGRDQPRDLRSKGNFMRFGRSQYNRDGRSKDNFIRFGRNFSRNVRKDNFIRFGRAKDNFIRFGRLSEPLNRNGRSGEDGHFRSARTKDNFMRFGRSGYDEDDELEQETNDSQRKERSLSNQNVLNCIENLKNNPKSVNRLRLEGTIDPPINPYQTEIFTSS